MATSDPYPTLSFVPAEMADPAPYHLLTSIVAPRPIAWISTLSPEGVPNLAPYSFYNAVAGFPPTIMFSVSYRQRPPHEKDTLRNVKDRGSLLPTWWMPRWRKPWCAPPRSLPTGSMSLIRWG
ncbi:MAG: hypothetical protein LVS60_00275 [Nodosilinea sp. LVE1205-7]